MVVSPPSQTYLKMIDYATKKKSLRMDQLFLQAVLAGYWIAIYGHAILKFGGSFYVENDAKMIALSNLVFAFLFPGAFMALVYTGSELFTGNTVTMVLLVCQKGKKEFMNLVKVWGISFVGNFIGCTLCAYFFSSLSPDFKNNSLAQQYLFYLTHKKTSYGFGGVFLSAIGCNSLVCLATWCAVCSEDGAGKIMAMFYCVAVFVFGGYEHIIANIYFLSLGIFAGFEGASYGQVIYKNWIPTFLGNVTAGTIFTGLLWWYALHPNYTDLAPYTDAELVRELSMRHSDACKTLLEKSEDTEASKGNDAGSSRWSKARARSNSFLAAPHASPVATDSTSNSKKQDLLDP